MKLAVFLIAFITAHPVLPGLQTVGSAGIVADNFAAFEPISHAVSTVRKSAGTELSRGGSRSSIPVKSLDMKVKPPHWRKKMIQRHLHEEQLKKVQTGLENFKLG